MRTYRKFCTGTKETLRINEDGFDDVVGGGHIYDEFRFSLTEKLAIVSKGGKFGILLIREAVNCDSKDIFENNVTVCRCKYDEVYIINNPGKNFCDFQLCRSGKRGIGRVSIKTDGLYTRTEFYEILPCKYKEERNEEWSVIWQYSDDCDYIKYYHNETHEISDEYTAIHIKAGFLICIDDDRGLITLVHEQTNKTLFSCRAKVVEHLASYVEGEVFLFNNFDIFFLVFCNTDEMKAYATDILADLRAEVTCDTFYKYLTHLVYKTNFEWCTLRQSGDVISQKDISNLTNPRARLYFD